MTRKLVSPFHLFCHRGGWYAININRMSATAVDEAVAAGMGRLAADPGAMLEPGLGARLEALGFLSDSGAASPGKRKRMKRASVVNMSLFITQSCNLKCVYCYGDGGEYGSAGDMDEETAFRSVDWLLAQSGKMKKVSVTFFGGEPLLRFDLMKSVVGYAKERARDLDKRVGFYVVTNGTLLDDEKTDFIIEQEMGITVSFDGLKALQDSQRPFVNGQGSYDIVLPKIRKLLEKRPSADGHAVIIGDTDPGRVKAAMAGVGFKNITVKLASGSLLNPASDSLVSRRETGKIIGEMTAEAEAWVALAKGRDADGLKRIKDRSLLYPGIISLAYHKRKFYYCGAGLGFAGVSCKGDVYLCHRFVGNEAFKIGSVFETGLDRERYFNSPALENELCVACVARFFCAGGCKHDNVGACGSIDAPPEQMCRLKRRELELAATIVSRLDTEDMAFLVDRDVLPPKPCPFDF